MQEMDSRNQNFLGGHARTPPQTDAPMEHGVPSAHGVPMAR